MKGQNIGAVAKIREINPECIHFHCIIHQEAICSKIGIPSAKKFADDIMKLVNKCVSSGALRHRQFREFLDEKDSEISDISRMQQVRWLSCEKVFRQFFFQLGWISSIFCNKNVLIIMRQFLPTQTGYAT